MPNYQAQKKAFLVITDAEEKLFGPFDSNDAMRDAIEGVQKQYTHCTICLLEQYSKFKIKPPMPEIVAQESVPQVDDRDRIPDAPKAQLPTEQETEEVLSYRASLEALNDSELRELATLKGVDGRISTRDRLIAELVTIFKLG